MKTASMRVLVVGPLPPPIGGMATYVQTLIQSEFSPLVALHLANTAKGEGNRTSWRRVSASFRATARVAAALVRSRPAVVHIHTSSYAGFFEKSLFVLLAQLSGARAILHVHGAEFDRFLTMGSRARRHLIRILLRRCDSVVALSGHWADILCELGGVPRSRITVIPNGVRVSSDPLGSRERPPASAPVVLFLSRVHDDKGIPELLEAVSLLRARYRDLRLVVAGPIAGGAAAAERYRALAHSLGIAAAIEWRGVVTGAAKERCFAEVDVFVLPSHAEGLPISMLEAMAAGVPVVATTVGAIPEVIVDGETGLLVPVGDAHAIAAAVDRLLASPELRQQLAGAARALVAAEYSMSVVVSRLEDLYLRVAAGSR